MATPRVVSAAALCALLPCALAAQVRPRPDSGAVDSLRPYALPPLTVSVSRLDLPLTALAGAVETLNRRDISHARPTWALGEALDLVPGVYVANRYNFSLDQRLSIRGFGARSSFGVRGIKILLDGIPQTLPDGSAQLTNLEIGAADELEVLRGPSSARFGNASGGVISIRTGRQVPRGITQEVRAVAGSFDRHQLPLVGGAPDQTWSKWQSITQFRVGQGAAAVTLSRLRYRGQRQHSDADFRNLNLRLTTLLSPGLTLSLVGAVGQDPRADNPGALNAAELARNPDSAAAINLSRNAGKDVTQYQGGLTLRSRVAGDGEAAVTLFGISRDLENPQTFAYIRLDRRAYGLRASVTHPVRLFGLEPRLALGLDLQRQRDSRTNFGNTAGRPDTVRQLDQRERVSEAGPFLEAELRLDPRTTLTGGLRYDWTSFRVRDRLVTTSNPDDSGERSMRSPSGSVGATRALGGAATVYATVGTSFETPTTTELTNRPDTAGGFNATLGPQRATNFEIGLRGAAGGRLRYSLALYHDAVRGELIAYQVVGSPGRVFFQNSGRSRHRGVELGAAAALVPGLGVRLAWTHSDFRYTRYTVGGRNLDGRPIPGIPADWLHVVWQVRPVFAAGAWAELEHTHSSSVLLDDTLSTRVGPWWTLDVRVGWEGSAGGVHLAPFIGLNNAFDRRYVSSVVINAANGRYYEPAPGRNGYLGLSIRTGR